MPGDGFPAAPLDSNQNEHQHANETAQKAAAANDEWNKGTVCTLASILVD